VIATILAFRSRQYSVLQDNFSAKQDHLSPAPLWCSWHRRGLESKLPYYSTYVEINYWWSVATPRPRAGYAGNIEPYLL